jgi:phosphoglycerate kinase
MELLSIKELDLDGKRVFIRCDFNVPKDEFGNISDDRRIRSALPTIRYCMDRDCKIILASHFGRPNPESWNEDKDSLKPIAKRLHSLLKMDIIMADNVVGDDTIEKAKGLEGGEIMLLENLRYNPGEMANDSEFAERLASMADFYINDAFGASHRRHASIFALPEHFDVEHKAAGFLMQKEVTFFHRTVMQPSRPFIAVVGGSKVSGKLQALVNLVEKVDKIIIGGGMAFTFLKAQGYEIGKSLVEDHLLEDAKKIIYRAQALGVKFYLPVDLVVSPEISDSSPVKFFPIQ